MRLTKRLAVMDCESCGMRERGCTAQYCRNRLKDVLAKYEDENTVTPPIMRAIDYDKLYLAVMDAALSSVDEDTIFDLMDSAVVDADPVIRCRECLFHDPENDKNWCGHPKGIDNPADDDFYSYGVKKE